MRMRRQFHLPIRITERHWIWTAAILGSAALLALILSWAFGPFVTKPAMVQAEPQTERPRLSGAAETAPTYFSASGRRGGYVPGTRNIDTPSISGARRLAPFEPARADERSRRDEDDLAAALELERLEQLALEAKAEAEAADRALTRRLTRAPAGRPIVRRSTAGEADYTANASPAPPPSASRIEPPQPVPETRARPGTDRETSARIDRLIDDYVDRSGAE